MVEEKTIKKWTLEESKALYLIDKWSEGYFHINQDGNVAVTPYRDAQAVDLHKIVEALSERGVKAPILIRFDGIIKDRLKRIKKSFAEAIDLYQYQNHYRHVYPIKVNQQKHVVESIRDAGSQNQTGLEVGSKPELLAMLSIPSEDDTLVLCNGYKDREYIELALLSRKLGKRTIIVIEQLYECQLILDIAQEMAIEAEVGFRIKPSVKGSGRWASSGGDFAKFGLNTHEILSALELLSTAGKKTWVKLIHFHIGSQLTSILPFKKTLAEAAHFYTELAKEFSSLEFFDVGGGLGVDYDGSSTAEDSSMNYTMEEYARDIVYTLQTVCSEKGVKHPILISESGRALVAHQSVLVTEVIDASIYSTPPETIDLPPTKNTSLNDLYDIYTSLTPSNCLEALHDAHYIKEQVLEKFIYGGLSLKERAYVEQVYRYLAVKVERLCREEDFSSEDIQKLSALLVDTYFCNFSVFQSLPDAWAIDQLFPVMPIHCLDKEPKRKAKIVDLSCDSDGTIEKFIAKEGTSSHLMLHELLKNKPYYIGVFLVGAYQEALGGLHNLFGDTNAIHIDLHEDGTWRFKNLIEGDTIKEILHYMQYDEEQFRSQLHHLTENSVIKKRISNEEALMIKKKYKSSFENYTYLLV